MLRYSKGQWDALIWSSRLSAFFSILGSVTVIFMILRRRKVRLALFHNRLVLGMCLMDIVSSIGWGANVTMAPSYLRNRVYPAYGNEITCNIQGFFITLGLCVPFYNCCLCLYYMFYIRYEVKEDIFKKYEKYFHAIAVLPPLSVVSFFKKRLSNKLMYH